MICPAAAPPRPAGDGKPRIPSGRLRNSCDFCTRRKRKCDGKTPCSFCIAKNQPECHYSVRLLTGPKTDSASKWTSKGLSGGPGNGDTAAGEASSGGGSGGLASAGGLHSTVVPLKRARLSPSLATGLVGLKENVFIGDFFRTMSFLPVTAESFIRKAMVSTIFRTMQQQNPGFPGYSGRRCDSGEEGGRWEGTMLPRVGGASEVGPEGEDDLGTESEIESAAAACVLWSTVGVGCLLQGRQKSSVEGYAQLAREALSVCFDDGSVHTARAFTAMTFLQIFLGNADKFNKYIRFAKTIVEALPPGEVPVDLADTLEFMKACDMFVAHEHDELGEQYLKDAEETVANGYEPCSSVVKDPRLIHQAELCRWFVKTDIYMAACFSVDMFKGDSNEDGNIPSRDSVSSVANGDGAINGGDGAVELSTKSPPHVVCDEGVADANTAGLDNNINSMETSAEPPPPGEMSRKFAADVLPECQLLGKITQSPNVRGGFGELYAQSIRAYVYSLQGNQEGVMDALWRSADIFVQNPGICRFTAWVHLAHCALGCLVLSGRHGKYEELRNACNSVVDGDTMCFVKVPPIEEWSGMRSLCENMFCMSLYNVLAKVPVLAGEPASLSDDAITSAASISTTGVLEAIPFTPSSEGENVGMDMNLERDTSYSSSASDDSWARSIFAERQPADGRDGKGQASHGAPAEAATRSGSASAGAPASAYPTPGFVGSFGGGAGPVGQPPGPRVLGMGSGLRPAAGSPTVSMGAHSNRTWPMEVFAGGSAAPAAAAPPTSPTAAPAAEPRNLASAEHDTNCAHPEAGGSAPLSLLSSVPSASSPPAPGEKADDLELLDASELEGPNAAGLLDALDAFLGEAVLEGLGEEGSSEEDLLPFFEGNV